MERMDNVVSANYLAEKRYRNIDPCLIHSIGSNNKKQNAGVNFNSIPVVCVLPGSHSIATTEYSTTSNPSGLVRIFDSKLNGRPASSFGISTVPREKEQVAICVGDGISLWDVDGKSVAYFASGQVQNCSHVTGLENGQLATTCVTDERGKCVTIWDPKSGKITSQFGSPPEIIENNRLMAKKKIIIRNEDIRLPWFITSDKKNYIYISDRVAKSIKVFDTRNCGKFVKKIVIEGPVKEANNPILPQGICTDDMDNIILADSYTHTVLLFDSNGQFVKTLLRRSKVTRQEPWAIDISKTPPLYGAKDSATRLVLSVATPHPVLQVYKLSFCKHYVNVNN